MEKRQRATETVWSRTETSPLEDPEPRATALTMPGFVAISRHGVNDKSAFAEAMTMQI